MQRMKNATESLKEILFRFSFTYRVYLNQKGCWATGRPNAARHNGVLKTSSELSQANLRVRELRLLPHEDPPKDWDSLAMLDCALTNAKRHELIIDAGAETYSSLLPNLFLYGYTELIGLNLSFEKTFRRGPIIYERGDITKTRFANNQVAFVACQSVIEHGVDMKSFFAEMSRILKPNGLLSISTDYYIDHVRTEGIEAYGVPVKIFSKNEIVEMLRLASEFGLVLEKPTLDLDCEEKPIHWLGLDYTFVIFTLKKKAACGTQT